MYSKRALRPNKPETSWELLDIYFKICGKLYKWYTEIEISQIAAYEAAAVDETDRHDGQ